MKSKMSRMRLGLLCAVTGMAFQFGGCLSDRQATQIAQSVITAGLTTIVTSALSGALGGTSGATN